MSLASVTAEALSKSSTVGIDVAEIQYAAAKFVFTEVECLFLLPCTMSRSWLHRDLSVFPLPSF